MEESHCPLCAAERVWTTVHEVLECADRLLRVLTYCVRIGRELNTRVNVGSKDPSVCLYCRIYYLLELLQLPQQLELEQEPLAGLVSC